MRNRKRFAAIAVTAALLVPLAVFGAPALASSQQSSSAQYQYGTTKVSVCHKTHSTKNPWVKITVSMQGWLHGHQRHGDFLVTGATPCPPPPPTGAAATNNNSNNQGNNTGNGHGNNGHHGKP